MLRYKKTDIANNVTNFAFESVLIYFIVSEIELGLTFMLNLVHKKKFIRIKNAGRKILPVICKAVVPVTLHRGIHDLDLPLCVPPTIFFSFDFKPHISFFMINL